MFVSGLVSLGSSCDFLSANLNKLMPVRLWFPCFYRLLFSYHRRWMSLVVDVPPLVNHDCFNLLISAFTGLQDIICLIDTSLSLDC